METLTRFRLGHRATLASLLLAIVVVRVSGQTTISIPGAGFEAPDALGSFASFSGSDWQLSGGGNAGVISFAALKVSVDKYPSAVSAPEGTQIGFINSGRIFQDLSATYVAGNTYTLSGYVGARTDDNGASASFNLMDGSTVLATSGPITPTAGTFQFVTFSYTAPGGVAGHTIRVDINQEAAFQVNFDAIALTAIPEPGTYAAVLGAVALGAVAWRRRASVRLR